MKDLKIAALTNGIHIFEADGDMLGNCVKKNVTEEVSQQLVGFMKMKEVEAVSIEFQGETYFLKLELDDEDYENEENLE